MENSKFENFKKYGKIFFLILIAIISINLIFFNVLEPEDELWNFMNTFKMNDYTIYSETNVIVTPIFFYIGHLLFKIFGSKMIIFRIYSIIIFLSLYLATYCLMKNLKISKHISYVLTILLSILTLPILTAGANYNVLVIVFSILGINLYIKQNENSILAGIVMFLVFFTKQNIGIYFILASIICDIYLYKFSKKLMITELKKFLGFIVCSSILLGQMYYAGNLYDFTNLAFGGLLEFGSKNIYFLASPYQVAIYITTIILYIFIKYNKNKILKNVITDEQIKNLDILMIFTIFISLIIYPLMNQSHFISEIPLHFTVIAYIFNILLIDELYGSEKYTGICNFIGILLLVVLTARIGLYYEIKEKNISTIIKDSNSPFYAIPVHTEYLEKSITMEEYIKEKENSGIRVIIISEDSGIAITELNQNNYMYDLLFEGNIGYNGKEKIKKDILKRKDTEFLIMTDEKNISKQQSKEIRKFIIENLEYSGTISTYSIYKNN